MSTYPRIPISPRTCVKCGRVFQPNSGPQKYCAEHNPKRIKHPIPWTSVCDRCGKTFVKRGWRQRFCLSCKKNAYREYARVQNKIYYHRHPDRCKEFVKKTRAKRADYYREQSRRIQARTRVRKRRLVMEHYSKGALACACCGETEYDFLTIDHINNDGGKHRVEVFGTRYAGGARFYAWLVRNGFPSGYAVLCMNCNYSKGQHGACIHKLSR